MAPIDTWATRDIPAIALKEAYRRCQYIAETHYENFTVGSWFLPREKRKHFYAIYAFCRFVDDLGDEYMGDRLKALDHWEEEIQRCYQSTPKHPYMVALQDTIRTFDIPPEPFLKIIHANRMDQITTRYSTYKDLDYYCQHSANPVGHLVLYVCGYRDRERQRLSDYTCTALQLTNFWQDLTRDSSKGRIYIPLEDMKRFRYSEEYLKQGKVTKEFRNLMAFEVERTRELFNKGLHLIQTLDGRIRLDVKLFTLGGMHILETIESQEYNVLDRRPSLSKLSKLSLIIKAVLQFKLLERI